MTLLNSLIELDQLARQDGKNYPKHRFLYHSLIREEGRHFIGIAGPRGAGKTILLKQLTLALSDTFYLSLDTFREDLFETVKTLHLDLGVKTFLLDEVHMHPGFEAALKKIYDFLKVRIFFTSAIAIAIYETVHDLSRRVAIKHLYPFSFREYLFFKYDQQLPALSLEDLIEKRWDRKMLENGIYFSSYLRGGIMPFALQERDPLPLLKNIVETVIYKDISRTSKISMDEMDTIGRLLAFIGRSAIDGINYSSLSRNLGITKYKAEQYTGYLEKAFTVHRILPEGTGVLKEPKIVMALPYRLLYRNDETALGGLREDFFVEALKACGFEIRYLKSTRGEKTPDYVISSIKSLVFEIGGKGKGRQQFKGFKTDRKIVLADSYEGREAYPMGKCPLFLLGFLSSKV